MKKNVSEFYSVFW